jgi:FtsH-binding integral membrane protein
MFPQTRVQKLEYGTDERVVFNFFNTVYAWMAVGLAVTATVAYLVAQSPAALSIIYGSRAGLAVGGLAAFAIAWGVQSMAMRISPAAATAMFLLYAAVIGALLSGIFLTYKLGTIGSAFVITGGVFGGMSVYGFVTKRDLTSMGSILIMCAWGLFLASLVNIFLASTVFSWFITYAVLAVFIGLTAYDTQKLREIALQLQGNPSMAARYAIVGSLHLYVDFINIFISILRILGSRR